MILNIFIITNIELKTKIETNKDLKENNRNLSFYLEKYKEQTNTENYASNNTESSDIYS